MVLWAKQVATRRGSQVAIIALARKLAHVLYALWKHDTTYDPVRSATAGGSVDERRGDSGQRTMTSAHLDGCLEAMTAH